MDAPVKPFSQLGPLQVKLAYASPIINGNIHFKRVRLGGPVLSGSGREGVITCLTWKLRWA